MKRGVKGCKIGVKVLYRVVQGEDQIGRNSSLKTDRWAETSALVELHIHSY